MSVPLPRRMHLADSIFRDPEWLVFSNRDLQTIRVSLDLSIDALAKLAGITRWQLTSIEGWRLGSEHEPHSRQYLIAMAKALPFHIMTRPKLRAKARKR